MSTNAPHVFGRLRELLEATDLNLSQLSRRTKVSYDKLRRFSKHEKSLSLEDAELLHIELTGKSFIAPDNDIEHS